VSKLDWDDDVASVTSDEEDDDESDSDDEAEDSGQESMSRNWTTTFGS
jgi:hypothetical protein